MIIKGAVRLSPMIGLKAAALEPLWSHVVFDNKYFYGLMWNDNSYKKTAHCCFSFSTEVLLNKTCQICSTKISQNNNYNAPFLFRRKDVLLSLK